MRTMYSIPGLFPIYCLVWITFCAKRSFWELFSYNKKFGLKGSSKELSFFCKADRSKFIAGHRDSGIQYPSPVPEQSDTGLSPLTSVHKNTLQMWKGLHWYTACTPTLQACGLGYTLHVNTDGGGKTYPARPFCSARIYRTDICKNKPKKLFFNDWKRAFWACFRETGSISSGIGSGKRYILYCLGWKKIHPARK